MYSPTSSSIQIMNPLALMLFVGIILIFFFVLYSFSNVFNMESLANFNSNTSSTSSSNISTFVGILAVIVLVALIVINALQLFFNVNITAYIKGLYTPNTTVDIVVDETKGSYQPAPVPEIKFKKQVFNIPGNYYNYANAKALCTAYGAELATYDQIEKAYNDGAEWCNYGWSADQLALFPTQKKTYDTLQSTPGHENDCGRTGVNGGYIANPNVQFGVNCYGNKPKITGDEEELMKKTNPYPVSAQDIAFQKKVDMFKQQLGQILVSPFNYDTWGTL